MLIKLFIAVLLIVLLICVLVFNDFNSSTAELRFETQDQAISAYHQIISMLKANEDIPYGGTYIDDNNVLNIALVGNKREDQEFIKSLVGGNCVKFFNVKYTYKELKDIQIRFRKYWDVLSEEGIYITGTLIDPYKNKVYIELKPGTLSDETIKKIEEVVGNGDAIEFRENDWILLSEEDKSQ